MLKLILTCEHGGNDIPAPYTPLFEKEEALLQSHRGYDIGALELYHKLEPLADKSFHTTTSRLLVELNRSLHHRALFSEVTQQLPEHERKQIINSYYTPYREQVETLIQDFIQAGRRVLHLAVHTFTPVLGTVHREGDIGLLYDPKRKAEQQFCRTWKKLLELQDPNLIVRFNYPYLGISDGFPTYLRKRFGQHDYIGIELEVNQKFVQQPEQWQQVQQVIYQSLRKQLLLHRPANPNEETA